MGKALLYHAVHGHGIIVKDADRAILWADKGIVPQKSAGQIGSSHPAQPRQAAARLHHGLARKVLQSGAAQIVLSGKIDFDAGGHGRRADKIQLAVDHQLLAVWQRAVGKLPLLAPNFSIIFFYCLPQDLKKILPAHHGVNFHRFSVFRICR